MSEQKEVVVNKWVLFYQRQRENLARARAIKKGLIPRPIKPVETPEQIKEKEEKQRIKDRETYNKRIKSLKAARETKKVYAEIKRKYKPAKIPRKPIDNVKRYDVSFKVRYNVIDRSTGKLKTPTKTYDTSVKTAIKSPNIENLKVKNFLIEHAYKDLILSPYNDELDKQTIQLLSATLTPIINRPLTVANFVFDYEKFGTADQLGNYDMKNPCWYQFLTQNNIPSDEIINNLDLNKTHMLVSDLFKFVKKCNRSIYLVDLFNKIFCHYVQVDTHKPALFGLIANQHIYNITRPDLKKSIVRKAVMKSDNTKIKISNNIIQEERKAEILKTEDKREHMQLPEIVDMLALKDNCIYYDKTNNTKSKALTNDPLVDWLHAIIQTYKIIPENIKYVGSAIVSMTFKKRNITFWHNPAAAECLSICNTLKIKYTNQSIQALSKLIIVKADINRNNLMSKFNVETRKIFLSADYSHHLQCGGLNYRPNDAIKTLDDRWEAYDIKKCYSHVISTYKLPVLSEWDEIMPYSGSTNSSIVKNAFYFIKTTNILMRAYGWYVGHLVEYCLSDGLICLSDITHMIIPASSSGEFKKLVSSMHKAKLTDHAKLLTNAAIGALAQRDNEIKESIFTQSVDEACYYRLNYNSQIRAINVPIDDLKNKSLVNGENPILYKVDQKVKQIYSESAKPAYVAICQIAFMLVHKLYKTILENDKKAKLLCLHVDCVYIQRSNKKVLKIENCLTNAKSHDNIGYIRRDPKIPDEFKQLENKCFSSEYDYVLPDYKDEEIKEWDETEARRLYNKYESCLVLGEAGTGKTKLLTTWRDEALKTYKKNQVVTLAYTNSAVNGNIKGITLHNMFGIKLGIKKTKTELKRSIIDNIKVCFIDEVSLVPAHIYNYILLLKRIGVKIYIFGDFNQIAPIEDVKRDYENSIVLKQLTSYNRVILTHNYRSDSQYVKICRTGAFPEGYFIRNNEAHNEYDKFNIARYRDICNDINKKCADIYGKHGENGSRLIININNRKLSIYKNQFYEVINKDEKKIKQLFVDDAVERVIIDWDALIRCSGLGYCTTVEKSQGLTIKEKYTIYNYNIFDLPHRYVALTRTSNKDLVRVDMRNSAAIYKIVDKNGKITDIKFKDTTEYKFLSEVDRKNRLEFVLYTVDDLPNILRRYINLCV